MWTGKINPNESAVLAVIARSYGETAYYFRGIAEETGLELKTVRRACRSLARKGLAEYMRGLFSDCGNVAGSGYGATPDGLRYVREHLQPPQSAAQNRHQLSTARAG